MVRKVTEKMIENQVLSWLKLNRERGIHGFKVRSTGTYDPARKRFRSHGAWFQRGCPDVLCCFRGRFIGLEIKTPKGALSIHQKLFHQDIRQAGGEVFVVRRIEDLPAIFANNEETK